MAPEALDGGLLAHILDGDRVRVDAANGVLEVLDDGVAERPAELPDLSSNGHGIGRELFDVFRQNVGPASTGAGVVV